MQYYNLPKLEACCPSFSFCAITHTASSIAVSSIYIHIFYTICCTHRDHPQHHQRSEWRIASSVCSSVPQHVRSLRVRAGSGPNVSSTSGGCFFFLLRQQQSLRNKAKHTIAKLGILYLYYIYSYMALLIHHQCVCVCGKWFRQFLVCSHHRRQLFIALNIHCIYSKVCTIQLMHKHDR